VWRLAEAASECAAEVEVTQFRERGEIFDADGRVQISIDVCRDSTDLPWRQTSSNTLRAGIRESLSSGCCRR
jgi:hypothetical protein